MRTFYLPSLLVVGTAVASVDCSSDVRDVDVCAWYLAKLKRRRKQTYKNRKEIILSVDKLLKMS
jgi:hypothetical protein